jgi:16S rRNA processing protein RimM
MKKEYLECGRVCTAHGILGQLKIEHWCDSPKVLATQKRVFTAEKDGSYTERKITSAKVANNFVLLSLEGITDREAAFNMRGITLYLKREDLKIKKGTILLQDIIGMPVIDKNTGKVYGTVTDITDAPASQIYTINCENKDVLLPNVKEFVKEIDEEKGVFITPIPGFFD